MKTKIGTDSSFLNMIRNDESVPYVLCLNIIYPQPLEDLDFLYY